MNEIDVVRDISRRFDQTGINYMLTGSMAMNYYAQPRMTRDIDIVIAITHKDVERVGALFRPEDRKSTRLNSSHEWISYAVFCLKKKKHLLNSNKTLIISIVYTQSPIFIFNSHIYPYRNQQS